MLGFVAPEKESPSTCELSRVKASGSDLQRDDPRARPPSQVRNPCSFIKAGAFVPLWRGLTLHCRSKPLWVMTCYIGEPSPPPPPRGSNHSSDGTVGKWDKLASGSNYTGLASRLSRLSSVWKLKAMKKTRVKELPRCKWNNPMQKEEKKNLWVRDALARQAVLHV